MFLLQDQEGGKKEVRKEIQEEDERGDDGEDTSDRGDTPRNFL